MTAMISFVNARQKYCISEAGQRPLNGGVANLPLLRGTESRISCMLALKDRDLNRNALTSTARSQFMLRLLKLG